MKEIEASAGAFGDSPAPLQIARLLIWPPRLANQGLSLDTEVKKISLTLCGSRKAKPAWAVRPREKPGSAPPQLGQVKEMLRVFALKFKRHE